MTKLGVVSDSHQNSAHLSQTIEALHKEKINLFIHLGDDYCDIPDEIPGFKVIKVPGVYDPEYEVTSIPNRLVIQADSVKILLIHSPQSHQNNFPDEDSPVKLAQREAVKLILYGHTHIPAIKKKEEFIWVNPGHLKSNDKKGHPASYAVIEIEPQRIKVRIIDLLKQTLLETQSFL